MQVCLLPVSKGERGERGERENRKSAFVSNKSEISGEIEREKKDKRLEKASLVSAFHFLLSQFKKYLLALLMGGLHK